MVKVLLILVVFAILMEDGSSIKKSEEEKREEKELAELVNKTLAEEEKKKAEEEKKKTTDGVKDGRQEDGTERATVEKQEGQDEACPPANYTCPIVEPCPPCPEIKECETCKPSKDCPPIKKCGPCEICKECGQCPTVKSCKPCAVANNTSSHEDCPVPPACLESSGLTLPAAMAVGAVTGILVTGIAATVGLILRYVPPIASGFLFLASIIIVWYLCSQYPETARELGGRATTLLREAATALGHRVMAAIQRHNEQVGFPV
jgi:hypothetical protein